MFLFAGRRDWMKKQAKLRAKQVFHWIYHRGIADFFRYDRYGEKRCAPGSTPAS